MEQRTYLLESSSLYSVRDLREVRTTLDFSFNHMTWQFCPVYI